MSYLDSRTPDPNKTIPVSFTLPPKVNVELDRIAAKAKLSRSKLGSNLLQTGVEGLGAAEKLKILDPAAFTFTFVFRIREKIQFAKKQDESAERAKSISFTVPLWIMDRLDYFARKVDTTPGKLAQLILVWGVQELLAGEKLGFFQTALFIRDFKEKLPKKFWNCLGFSKSREELEDMTK